MRHALGLGARGLGATWPNPAVGCVIVAGGRIVGRGWTAPSGRPHAETQALAQAGAAARGATAYVTLEPCAHHGQTPPCAEALITAGVARVVTALSDPDPRVAGRGHAILRAAGIAVTEGVEAGAARQTHAGFLRRVTQGLPALTLKLATSLDGRIATAAGESRWITGPEARRHVHALRLCHDAVMIGAGTARADDPDLRVRDLGAQHQPVRIVLDTRLSLDPAARLGQSAREAPVWLCHGPAAPEAARSRWAATGARLIACEATAGGIDVTDALRRLAALGLTRVLCEGGGQLAASLLRDGLVTEAVLYTAGLSLGADGRAAVGPMDLAHLADAPRFRLAETTTLGPDVMTRWIAP
jgi:diaminohydroxyphosphoribosylaminopyrimidine deaminase/5-amino-6-(5-phosphoribosylamino)uracil reductase